MLRISSYATAPGIIRHMYRTSGAIENSLKELASGSRLVTNENRSSDRAIADNLKSEIAGLGAADRNAQQASSFTQITEGALNEQSNLLIRMRELAVQASGTNFNDSQRVYANLEFQQLAQEVDRIAKVSGQGPGPSLTGESQSFEFQVGTRSGEDNMIKFNSSLDTTASELGIRGTSLDDQGDAKDALEELDDAMKKLALARAQTGAVQNRLDAASSFLQTQVVNLSDAYGKYADTDVASAVTTLRSAMALQQYQVAALQASNDSQTVGLKLIA